MIWSYSFLNKFLQCPHEAWHRYVLRDVPYVETPQMKLGNEVHTALENRLKGKPLPKDYERYEFFAQPLGRYGGIQPEMKLGITTQGKPANFYAKEAWGRGKIDVPIVVGDSAVILDWKTGRVWEDPFELQVQAVLLKAHRPALQRIVGSYVWLAESRVGVTYTLDPQAAWGKICAIMDSVGHREKMGVWEKSPGKLCAWCPVKSCEHNKNRELE